MNALIFKYSVFPKPFIPSYYHAFVNAFYGVWNPFPLHSNFSDHCRGHMLFAHLSSILILSYYSGHRKPLICQFLPLTIVVHNFIIHYLLCRIWLQILRKPLPLTTIVFSQLPFTSALPTGYLWELENNLVRKLPFPPLS